MRTLAILLVIPSLAVAAEVPTPVSYQSYAVEPIAAHPEWDAEYTRQIREHTTSPELVTDLVDHLPASVEVPTPLQVNGYIAGAADHLTYASDVHAYMRALAAASPRVEVRSIGHTEEGREMILVAIADEATIAALDEFRAITAELSDPRRLADERAQELIARGKPIYYLTGGLHSFETGAPEMFMELAYRLAVEETPLVQSIRENVITLITPVLEVDGRERAVDLVRWSQANPSSAMPPLAYWGRYVAHDNNRDFIGAALALTRNLDAAYLDWHPQVLHDLHESIPFLYVSTGTGPYNAWLDPLVVQEWDRLAISEIQTLTAKGLPGVWTHGFFDGWAPGYLFWVALGRNSIGRFYETFGNALPATVEREVGSFSERTWFRPNPPYPNVRWSLRNNVNYSQSGVLVALSSVAAHPRHYLDQYWRLGKRSVAKATSEGPAAYVFAGDQKRQGQLRDLLDLLRRRGVEVNVASETFSVARVWPPEKPGDGKQEEPAKSEEKAGKKGKGVKKEAGESEPKEELLRFSADSFVIRMDQPFSRLADALLDTQYVRGEERLYDDAGWTLGFARNLEVTRVVNPEVLAVPMRPWVGPERRTVEVRPRAAALAIANHADTDLVRLRVALPETTMLITQAPFEVGKTWPAGTVLLPLEGVDRDQVSGALAGLSLAFEPIAALPEVATHELVVPRLAVMHTWFSTQTEGWFRLALEDLGLPFDYISIQDVANLDDLRSRWDVILLGPVGRGGAQGIVHGYPAGQPVPWKSSELTPNLGVDETDDVRPGLGLAGVEKLLRFVEDGGVLLAVGDAATFAIDLGLARYVEVVETSKVKVEGSLLKAVVGDSNSPIAWGYDESLPVFLDRGPVFRVGLFRSPEDRPRPTGRGSASDPDVPQGRPFVAPQERPEPGPGEEGFQLPPGREAFYRLALPLVEDRPRVVVAFPEETKGMLLSGMLEGGSELTGKALVVDCPRGRGHIVLYGNNPMWRHNTQGSWALITNAILNHAHLGLGWPPKAIGEEK